MTEKRNWRKFFNGVIDIVMFIGLVGSIVALSVFEKLKAELQNGAKIEDVFSWHTSHCIISLILTGLMFIHILKHWIFLKTLISRKLYLKNKLTTLTCVLFILTVVSILLYLFGFTTTTLHFHSLIVPLFIIVLLVHLFMNVKKLFNMFKRG